MARAHGAWTGDEPTQTDATALAHAVMTLADAKGSEAETAATCALGHAPVFESQDYPARMSTAAPLIERAFPRAAKLVGERSTLAWQS